MFENEIKHYKEQHGFGGFSPKAVLFDMDGVLYNSMPNHAYSWHESMKTYGIVMSEQDAYACEGMRGVETIKKMAKEQCGREVSDDEAQTMYNEKARVYSSCKTALVMDGVINLQRLMMDDNMSIGVVTGSGQPALLNKLAIDFQGIVASDKIVSSFDVTRGKPNPEPYIKGMEKFGVKPWEAIVVENAPLGVRAGVAANIFTIAVNTGPLPDELLLAEGANLLFKNMNDFAQHWKEISANFD